MTSTFPALSSRDELRALFAEDDRYFPSFLQKFQYFDKYARYNQELGRRETWRETVDRAVSFLRELSEDRLPNETYNEIHHYILNMKAMPSMRLLSMAGPAARKNHAAIFNCTFVGIDDLRAFDEALYLSMSGCGVGFSVEHRFIDKLPVVQYQLPNPTIWTHVVDDSAEGWALAVEEGLRHWMDGWDLEFDYSQIRPAGSVLFTKGGRASGPEPLKKMLDFARTTILNAQGRQLTSLECHDIMCNIGDAAISGATRRTAMISLFDQDDELMLHAKDGDIPSYRWNANNSVVWNSVPRDDQIRQQFDVMFSERRGEPGIFSRYNAQGFMSELRAERIGRNADVGVNPCGEIVLQSKQMCNLSIAVNRSDDTLETLMDKVRVATIIGTIQSMATKFPVLRDDWRKNCETERLLGVDITGQLDGKVVQRPDVLWRLMLHAEEVNKQYAKLLDINQASAVTCVKPSGNSSRLLDCSSGIHPRWSQYYLSNVTVFNYSPIYPVLKQHNCPMVPANGEDPNNPRSWLLEIPCAAPKGAKTRHDISAIDQCEIWKRNKIHWARKHNPSVTITYQDHEYEDVVNWVIANKNIIGGMAFFPSYNQNYGRMPLEDISEAEYRDRLEQFPHVDFSLLAEFEREDYTTAAFELACSAGSCDISF